jgi:PKHD-type hydroxylase
MLPFSIDATPRTFGLEECTRLIDVFDRSPDVHDGRLAGGNQRVRLRDCRVLWVEEGPLNDWAFRRLATVVSMANREHFKFDLDDFREGCQIIRYGAPESGAVHGGHYGWHIDIGGSGASTSRKLSVSVQLSCSTSYSGGAMMLNADGDPFEVARQRGTAILFPSFTPHKICPVQSGARYALVAWVHGPAFR